MRRFLGRFTIALALIIGFITSIEPANADTLTTCVGAIGATSACPAQSPQELSYLYANNSNGTYWLNANGTSSATYFIMDTSTSYGGGNLFLLMKATKNSSNFYYSSDNFALSNNSQNDTSTANAGNNVTNDYKSFAYNNRFIHYIVAVFKEGTYPSTFTYTNAGDLGASNSFGGHTWAETLATDTNTYSLFSTTQQLLYGFSNIRSSLFKDGSGNQVFSYESPAAQYAFNHIKCTLNVCPHKWFTVSN